MSRYPARLGGNGASRVHDCLAKGLGELGHTVLYSVSEGFDDDVPLPRGVVASERDVRDADIYHLSDYPTSPGAPPPPAGKPWVRTFHAPYEEWVAPFVSDRFIYVSRAQAASFGSSRYVWNGIDPAELIYSEGKDDYFVFVVSQFNRAVSKGLLVAIEIVERLGARLVVAAHPGKDGLPQSFISPNVFYVGYLDGERKAATLARARALLFPVQAAETFGVVVAEALMSGTAVIGSKYGSLPELITPEVGFTCQTMAEYLAAAERVREIDPKVCRRRAMDEFHYHVMARRYVLEYERELAR